MLSRAAGSVLTVALLTAIPFSASASGGSTAKRFMSKRYGYSIVVPTGWAATSAITQLPAGYFPATNKPFADVVEAPGPEGHLVAAAARKLPKGATLRTWTSEMAGLLARDFGCTTPTARATGSLDREPARILTYRSCFSNYQVSYTSLDRGTGFVIYWISAPGHEVRDRAAFARMVKTFRFTR